MMFVGRMCPASCVFETPVLPFMVALYRTFSLTPINSVKHLCNGLNGTRHFEPSAPPPSPSNSLFTYLGLYVSIYGNHNSIVSPSERPLLLPD